MKINSGWVALLPLFLVSPRLLEERVTSEVPPLVKPARDPRIPPHEPDSSVIREVAIEVDVRLARDPQARKLRLPLFGGNAALDLVQMGRKVSKKGSVIWSGRVDGQPASAVVFSAGKEVLIGNIATQPTKEKSADYYEIRYLGGGRHILRQYDPSKIPPECDPESPELRMANASRSIPDDPPPICSTDPATTIDALIVYTPKAKDAVNGQAAMEEAIEVYVEQTNISYQNSGVAQRLRLVHTQEVDYQERNPESDRNRLKAPRGELAEVHGIRDAVGADVVALVVEYRVSDTWTLGCGNAYIMETLSNVFESSAFTAVPRICADRSYSLTHELGHLMGARHDWAADGGVASSDKPFLFSHGYFHLPRANDPGPGFRTLMAKTTGCQKKRCDRVLFWSNPDVTYPGSGSPMGVATGEEPSNNSQTLNNTASTVANFRCRKN